MKDVKFSVHIPVYNGERFLDECVKSVLNQSYQNFEIILTDDGSTDNSASLCDNYKDERISVYHNENQGPILTRAFSISKAVGEYSVFLDCDDFFDLNLLEELNKIIEESSPDIIVFGFKKVTENSEENSFEPWKKTTLFSDENIDEFREKFILNSYLNSICTKAVRTELLRKDKTDFNSFRFCFSGEDLLISSFPVFNAESVVYTPKHLYNYRVNDEGITHTFDSKKYKSILKVRENAYGYFEKCYFYNENNFNVFACGLIRTIMQCVVEICSSSVDKNDKLFYLNDIQNDEFFKQISKKFSKEKLDKKARIIYELFIRKKYNTLLVLCRIK